MPARNSFERAGRSYGRVWFFADERDRSVEALRAERLRAAAAREAGADDDDAPGHQAACLPRSS